MNNLNEILYNIYLNNKKKLLISGCKWNQGSYRVYIYNILLLKWERESSQSGPSEEAVWMLKWAQISAYGVKVKNDKSPKKL